jgi:predicted XRE-type DNA-binding protein
VRLRAVLKEERATDEKVEAALAHAGMHAEPEAVAARRLQAVARGHHIRAHKEEWHPEMEAFRASLLARTDAESDAAAEEEADRRRQLASELSRIDEARQAEQRQAATALSVDTSQVEEMQSTANARVYTSDTLAQLLSEGQLEGQLYALPVVKA